MAVKDKKPWRQTPLVESDTLSKAAGCRIFLKLENLQPSGSFKSRGIGNLLCTAMRRAQNPHNVHFFSTSGGNAALAAVHAANFLGRPCSVVVPDTTKPFMVEKIRIAGAAEVVQFGAGLREADAHLREVMMPLAEAAGAECVYVPPFDHQDIWDGHSTLMDELRVQFSELGESAPEMIACSVGGGGLMCGIVQGLDRLGGQWDDTQVLAVETLGADSLAQSLEAGELITLPNITSSAVTLGARRVAERTFELASKYQAQGRLRHAVYTDAEAAMACCRFLDTERMLVELACGVTLSLCYDGRLKQALGRPVHPDEKVVIVVCGGHSATSSVIEQWRVEAAELERTQLVNGN
ncbi:tryptophan synthase beta subunit-like PLP-dependent enzyme [Neohortaea acidophila]|uniref:L-serine ammonia-lyase n=1 Tax=Neohortaea acidophila TaxID=245834 RepID=A0A6A6PKM6_9PEZI|nr:tryptophan synthase beta subunit-like PLP-dependent enzyme [Neohortaea acidophila]KAF2480628.1 tryptophan synthase beta subunit-like PLP-dependent enzyme [Neohortaea acidophila]